MKKLYTFKNGPVFLAHPVQFTLQLNLLRISCSWTTLCLKNNWSLNFFSSLLLLLYVHYLFQNSFTNSVALYPVNWYKFFIRILFSSLKTIFTNAAVTYLPQFLKVVWQHMLGVMGNVIYYFVANLTDFSAAKEF